MTVHNQIQLFETKKIRTIWDDEAEKWYRKAYDGGIRDESQKALDELAATREREAASPKY